jgi:crotonobetainyl-CoA:carnitine CoA-transferase CaiB-like acyl-CoA transferase
LLGDSKREPLMLAGRQAAYSAGFLGFTAVMAALAHRDHLVRQGRAAQGQRIELSDLEAIAFLEWKGPVYYQAGGALVPRGRENGPLVLPCADGHFACFYSPPDWPALVEMFGSPPALADERFATPAGRVSGEAELRAILSDLTRNRTRRRRRDDRRPSRLAAICRHWLPAAAVGRMRAFTAVHVQRDPAHRVGPPPHNNFGHLAPTGKGNSYG